MAKTATDPGAERTGTTATCLLHKTHRPHNQTVEYHHIIPVAWQLHTTVPTPPYPGQDPDGRGMLWDCRGVSICPTGHRNTHYWIVTLMHAIAHLSQDDPQAAYATLTTEQRKLGEPQLALQALLRYAPYGSLLTLTQTGEWGQT